MSLMAKSASNLELQTDFRVAKFNQTVYIKYIVMIVGFTGIGDNANTIEAGQNKAYGVFSGDQEMATHTDESAYSYPRVDPDKSIEAKRNDAYAANIVTKKNEAYKPVSTASVSGTIDEYDYI